MTEWEPQWEEDDHRYETAKQDEADKWHKRNGGAKKDRQGGNNRKKVKRKKRNR